MKTTISTDSPVLVTGATGFFAGVLIKDLLDEGLTVHGTVRDIEDTDSYQHILDLPGAESRFKVFSADLLKAGTFKNAMEGCSIVFHTATPRPAKIKDPYKEGTFIDTVYVIELNIH
jgi:nucleoside-diphosphate-sugar epimerase